MDAALSILNIAADELALAENQIWKYNYPAAHEHFIKATDHALRAAMLRLSPDLQYLPVNSLQVANHLLENFGDLANEMIGLHLATQDEKDKLFIFLDRLPHVLGDTELQQLLRHLQYLEALADRVKNNQPVNNDIHYSLLSWLARYDQRLFNDFRDHVNAFGDGDRTVALATIAARILGKMQELAYVIGGLYACVLVAAEHPEHFDKPSQNNRWISSISPRMRMKKLCEVHRHCVRILRYGLREFYFAEPL